MSNRHVAQCEDEQSASSSDLIWFLWFRLKHWWLVDLHPAVKKNPHAEKLLLLCVLRSSVRSTGRPRTARRRSSRSSSSSSARRTTVPITPSATSASPTWVRKTNKTRGSHFMVESPPKVKELLRILNWIVRLVSVSPEEGEELGAGGDPHPVHELAGPRSARGGAAPPQAEAPRQRLQELLQRPHRGSLQVRLGLGWSRAPKEPPRKSFPGFFSFLDCPSRCTPTSRKLLKNCCWEVFCFGCHQIVFHKRWRKKPSAPRWDHRYCSCVKNCTLAKVRKYRLWHVLYYVVTQKPRCSKVISL